MDKFRETQINVIREWKSWNSPKKPICVRQEIDNSWKLEINTKRNGIEIRKLKSPFLTEHMFIELWYVMDFGSFVWSSSECLKANTSHQNGSVTLIGLKDMLYFDDNAPCVIYKHADNLTSEHYSCDTGFNGFLQIKEPPSTTIKTSELMISIDRDGLFQSYETFHEENVAVRVRSDRVAYWKGKFNYFQALEIISME
jgi:hypothetical protein